MTGRPGRPASAAGLIPFGVGFGLLMLARYWSTDVLGRSWLGPFLLVALVVAPLVWPLTDALVTGDFGVLRFWGSRLSRWRTKRSRRRWQADLALLQKRAALLDEYQQRAEKHSADAEAVPAIPEPRNHEFQSWLRDRLGGERSATGIADALKAAQRSWERYGYESQILMPRMLDILPDRVSRQLRRDAQGVSVWAAAAAGAFVVVPAAAGLAFNNSGGNSAGSLNLALNLVIAVYAALLARRCYQAAVSAAVGYAARVDSAVDLYRFKLLEQLHLPLPPDLRSEVGSADAVSRLLGSGQEGISAPERVKFEHPAERGGRVAEQLVEIVDRQVPIAVSASMQREFSGPELIRFDGRVGARVGAGEAGWDLAVAIGAGDLPFEVDQGEPLAVPGAAVGEVAFVVEPDSDTLAVTPPRAALVVAGLESSQATFKLAPLTAAAKHIVWVNVSQGTELVQVLSISFTGSPPPSSGV
jgi:hypothetical protein